MNGTVGLKDDVLTIKLCPQVRGHLRETVRQQLLGDVELMQDCRAGREDPEIGWNLAPRIEWLREVAAELGMGFVPTPQVTQLRLA